MYQAKQRVGEYVLDELVGQNAYAEAWRAHHHMWSDQEALVKIPTNAEYVNNLRQEGVRVQRLMHPSIIRPIGFDPTAEPPYLITEYVKGETLRAAIAGKRLSVCQSINILRHILEALQHGHERQVVHGDIKPENILLDSAAAASNFAAGESVKVTDFGIGLAAAATVTQDAAAKAQPQGGSLAYVAPEQRDGAPPDVKSDIYAVGVVLFEMLTGERPSGAELPSELNAEVPSSLDDVFRKSYARRERRFESAKAFLEALSGQGAVGAHPAPASSAPAAPPPPAPEQLRLRESPQENEIAMAPEEDSSPAAAAEPEAVADVESGDEIGMEEEDRDKPSPAAEEEELHDDEREIGADTAQLVEAEAQVVGEPVVPEIPRVPSRADRAALFDELNKRQIRTAEDLRGALKGYVELRDLDTGESANIRLRLMKWANTLAGEKTELDQQIVLINAAARPLYVVKFLVRSTRGDEAPHSVTLEHPIGDKAGMVLRAADYRLIAHFSADGLNERLLESITSTPLRMAVTNIARETRREFFGRIVREDVLIFRANVITAAYRFDQRKFRAFMVGNALSVVSAGEPFTKIRQEPTKRAATLLNGEQIRQGIKELRRGLDEPQWESKSMVILGALRGKLAAAYMGEAKLQFKSFGWLESLEFSGKAGQLVPGQEDALGHTSLVRNTVGLLQLLPGMMIAIVLVGLAVVWSLQQIKPFEFKPVAVQLVQSPFFAAGVAALIATLWSRQVLRTRMARTDFAFYQAAVFPLLIAGVIAFSPTKFASVTGDVVCAALLVVIIVTDVVVFKKLRRHLFRQMDEVGVIGDGMTVLGRIESLLDDDWEKLRPHYLELGPLYSFTTVHAAGGALPDLFQGSEEAGGEESSSGTVTGTWTPATTSADLATGDPDIDKLVGQMNSRISANLRTLAPAARMLLTIFNEYAKSIAMGQQGMTLSNAAKIEQKGKDLAGKLQDFERLCRSPLSLESGDNADQLREIGARLAQRCEEPDVRLLKSLADLAKGFRDDQANAAREITSMMPEVEAVIERIKKG